MVACVVQTLLQTLVESVGSTLDKTDGELMCRLIRHEVWVAGTSEYNEITKQLRAALEVTAADHDTKGESPSPTMFLPS